MNSDRSDRQDDTVGGGFGISGRIRTEATNREAGAWKRMPADERFRQAQLTAQGRQLASGQVDIALRQRLFSDRAALTLRIADLLNTQQYRNEIATDVLSSTRYSKDESRVGWLGHGKRIRESCFSKLKRADSDLL